jgi:hypothetical protein
MPNYDSAYVGVVVGDVSLHGVIGAYWRYVNGRGALPLAIDVVPHLFDLVKGGMVPAPGYIDLIPSPDGQIFVSPSPKGEGLRFYDATNVFRAAARGDARSVQPAFVDRAMRDYYPSVGILEREVRLTETRAVYRVLTAWRDRAMFRDYQVIWRGTAELRIRPVGQPLVACPGEQLSLPILAHRGREFGARDEKAAVTKILSLSDEGGCRETLNLGRGTGKIAWGPDDRYIAFATTAREPELGEDANRPDGIGGIFVLDRPANVVYRVTGGDSTNRLVFPEFVGADSIAFLTEDANATRLRIVCCYRPSGEGPSSR